MKGREVNRKMDSKEKGSLVLLRLAYYNDHNGSKQRSSLPSGLHLAPSVCNSRGVLLDKHTAGLPSCQDGNTVVKMTLPGRVKTLRITSETSYVSSRYVGNKAAVCEIRH